VISIAVFSVAWLVDFLLWIGSNAHMEDGLLSAGLIAALILANYVYLPMGGSARLWFTSAPSFLVAAVLTPPVAMLIAGVGMSAKETLICRKCQNTPAQVVGQVGRWMFLTLGASLLLHLAGPLVLGPIVIVALWAGDVLTAPLVLQAKPSVALIKSLARRTWGDEFIQYLMAYFLLPVFLFTGKNLWVLLPSIALALLWLAFYLQLRGGEPVGSEV
jgi:hypothetical protein